MQLPIKKKNIPAHKDPVPSGTIKQCGISQILYKLSCGFHSHYQVKITRLQVHIKCANWDRAKQYFLVFTSSSKPVVLEIYPMSKKLSLHVSQSSSLHAIRTSLSSSSKASGRSCGLADSISRISCFMLAFILFFLAGM